MARWCGSSTPAELPARRGRSLGLTAREEREGSAGGSERAHGHQQVKAGAWALAQAGYDARRRRRRMAATRRAGSVAVGRAARRDSEQARECGRAGGAAWAWAGEAAAEAKAWRGGRLGRLCGWAESEAAAH